MRNVKLALVLAAAMVSLPVSVSAQERAVPYWAAISAGDALMRTGPGRAYPAMWRYQRPGLPLKVVQVHNSWRKVRDMEGAEGWMAAVLLTAERSAIVVDNVMPLHASPDSSTRVLWRVEPGVVGKIRKCSNGWCRFTTQGKTGWIRMSGLWGVEAGEQVD